jgi:hypothetical protein
MSSHHSYAQEHLPAGIKARLAAYQDALKRKRELHKQVIIGADTDDIKRSYYHDINSPRRKMSPINVVGRVDRDRMNQFQSELPDVEPDPEEQEREARDNLHRMFEVVEGDAPSSPVIKPSSDNDEGPAFHHNRIRYLNVVETLVPAPLPEEAGDTKKKAIEEEHVKKEAYGSLKYAWDDYEVVALDRPKVPDPEEKKMRDRIAVVEDRIDMAWVQYAQEIVTRAVIDGDTDEAEIQRWQEEARRTEKESRQRRRRKVKHDKMEEEDYWKGECERLQKEIDDRSSESELGSDEEWVSDVSDPDD